MATPTTKPTRKPTRPTSLSAGAASVAPLLGRRRNAYDAEPLVTFGVLRKLRGSREERELSREVHGDGSLRVAIAARILDRMEETGESDTPLLDWIRDNWAWILQAIRDLTGFFGGAAG